MASGGAEPKTLCLPEMTWTDVRDAIREGFDTVVIAVGSTEQHGPHLPLSVDSLIGEAVAVRVAERLGNALVAPTICVGVSPHHMSFAGTITVPEDVLVDLVLAYCQSLAQHGFIRIALLPSHSGNCAAVRRVVERASASLQNTRVVGFWDMMGYFQPWYLVGGGAGLSEAAIGPHAGEAETSMVLALRPDLVRMKDAATGYVGDTEHAREEIYVRGHGVESVAPSGVLGDPPKAVADRGRQYLDATADLFARHFIAAFADRPAATE